MGTLTSRCAGDPASALASARAQVAPLGRTVVIAPHPDDETLGCGGLLALLAGAGLPLLVVLMSDGAASHPHSASHPAARLRAVRLNEMTHALLALGVSPAGLWAMGLADGAVPSRADPSFERAVERLACRIDAFQPQTVVLPWRHDAHADHRASHAIASAACDRVAPASRRLEYVVWATASQPVDIAREADGWRVDIGPVLDRKRRAIDAHRSQRGQVIADDPEGFVLPPDLLARCGQPTETYIDTTAWSAP